MKSQLRLVVVVSLGLVAALLAAGDVIVKTLPDGSKVAEESLGVPAVVRTRQFYKPAVLREIALLDRQIADVQERLAALQARRSALAAVVGQVSDKAAAAAAAVKQ